MSEVLNEVKKVEDIAKYIFKSSMTLANGKKIYAVNYGKKAFKIPIES